MPDRLQGRSAAADKAERRRRRAVFAEELRRTERVQVIQPGVERPILVGETVHIRRKVQRGELGERTLSEVVGLAAVQAELLEHVASGQLFGRIQASAEP